MMGRAPQRSTNDYNDHPINPHSQPDSRRSRTPGPEHIRSPPERSTDDRYVLCCNNINCDLDKSFMSL